MLLLHFRAYSQVCWSLKLGNFGLMIKCFSPVQAGCNWVGPRSGPENVLFLGQLQVEAKNYGSLRGRGAKNLAPQDSSLQCFLGFY